MSVKESFFHKIMRYFSLGLYYIILRHMPQYLPNGHECRNIRSIFCKFIFLQCGRNVNVKKGASFGSGKSIQIGNNSDIGINCKIFGIDGGGELVIGDNVMMAPEVIILTLSHDISTSSAPLITSKRKVTRVIIEDGAWIGIRCIIMPGVRIGKNAVIGAGAVITKDIPPNTLAGGVPAKVIKFLYNRSPNETF